MVFDAILHKAPTSAVRLNPIQLTAGPLSFYSPQPSIDGKRLFAIDVQLRAELVRYDAKSAQFVPISEVARLRK
jgi:hypothetical protein